MGMGDCEGVGDLGTEVGMENGRGSIGMENMGAVITLESLFDTR
jgi:hypothetical protein